MSEENEVLENQEPQAAEESALLKEYQKLKENSVSKEKYDADMKALKEKNDLYLKAITEGDAVPASEEDSGSVYDTISRLSKFKGTNLEFWDTTTKAIDKTLKAMPKDTLVNTVGADGLEELVKVNEAMKQMVEDANGDADYFRTLYSKRVQDSAPQISAEINKAGGLVEYLQKKYDK